MSAKQTGTIIEGQQGLHFAPAMLEGIACGVILLNLQGQIIAASGEAETILGWKAGQLLHAPLEVLPVPLLQIGREVLASGKAVEARLFSLTVGGRGVAMVRVRAVPMSLGKNEAGALLVLNDLTVARQLEAHLQQLDRLANAGTLAASMAHEIKNALVAGKTFIDLLLEKNQDAELAGIVRRELNRIDAIISRMLRFAAPGRAVFGPVGLHGVLEHSLRLVQPQMETQRLALERSFQAAPDLVEGDEYELQQAFVNLLLNAVEAMGAGGTLTVTTERVQANSEPPRLRVIIRDTGAGIAPENLSRLFETFFTTKSSGTGLGLAITQRIIQEHGGVIFAESAPGKGTAFSIVLPAG